MQINHHWLKTLSLTLAAAALVGCMEPTKSSLQRGQIDVKPFGHTKEGTAVNLYTLRNDKGAEVGICNYGGLVIFLKVPDRNGHMGDVVLGYDARSLPRPFRHARVIRMPGRPGFFVARRASS